MEAMSIPIPMHCSSLFSTPLWSCRYDVAADLKAWSKHILDLQALDRSGLRITNQGGWHSQTNLLMDPQLSQMLLWIASCSQQALQDFGWNMDKASPCFNNAWAMVNREGHSVRAHLHPNSLFSGVFYLAAPEGSGAIAFLDPRAGAQVLLPPLRDPTSGYPCGRILRHPSPGLLLLFPGWLWHEVEAGSNREARICVGFNIGIKASRGDSVQHPRSEGRTTEKTPCP